MTRPTISTTEVIDRSAPDIWTTLTDWTTAHEWMSGIDSMRADGPPVVGSQLTFTARGKERQSEISAAEHERSITIVSTQGGVSADYTYELHPIDDARTRVSLVANCVTSGLGWTAISPLLKIAIRRTDGDQIRRLKRLLEDPTSG